MEKLQRLQESTSSSFYDPKARSSSPKQFPIYQPMKSSFPELVHTIDEMNDRTPILIMEEDINQLRRKLRKIEENIGKISEVEELKTLIQKMQEQLVLARQKYLQQHTEVKEEIQNMLNCLEKQLQNYKKDWERLRIKSQQQLCEQIDQIRTQKASNEAFLPTLLKTTGVALREDINQFTQQLKNSKKNRNLRTSKIFSHLQSVRNNLCALVMQQEAKRNQYDEIIYGLLDKTCENAATAIRRRVY